MQKKTTNKNNIKQKTATTKKKEKKASKQTKIQTLQFMLICKRKYVDAKL